MRHRLPALVALAFTALAFTAFTFSAFALAALPACAQPGPEGRVLLQERVADGYEVRITAAPAVECADRPEPLFRPGYESVFETAHEADPCYGPAETLTLLHHGEAVDAVSAHRLWLGSASSEQEDEDPDAPAVPASAVQDLTGDGVPELIVRAWSGGVHCCFGYLVVELGAAPRLLAALDTEDSEVEVKDTDGDGAPELWHYDMTFAYWNESFAGSPAPHVALAWDGERFAPSLPHMARNAIAPDSLAALTADVRADPSWTSRSFPPTAYWGTLLDLLYAGQGAEAAAFAERAWPGDKLGRAVFLGWFADQLRRSPYHDFVWATNREAVDWL